MIVFGRQARNQPAGVGDEPIHDAPLDLVGQLQGVYFLIRQDRYVEQRQARNFDVKPGRLVSIPKFGFDQDWFIQTLCTT